MGNLNLALFFFVLTCCFDQSQPWSWFSSPTLPLSIDPPSLPNGYVAEFSMETTNDPKGIKLVEKARSKLTGPNSCWQNAYRNLFAGCSEILADKEKQSRLAWHLSDCFQKDSGRPAFPSCDSGSPMVKCLQKIDDFAQKIYLEFFLETNSICHQLQIDEFKRETERLVNSLKRSAQFTVEKLENIEEKSDTLLQNSNQIHDSLTLIDLQTQQVVQTSIHVQDQIGDVLGQSKAVFEQSKGIAASQSELQEGQAKMKERLELGMEFLRESYENLGVGIEKLRNGTMEIERGINQVGDSMNSKMEDLQNKANDIGDVVVTSLDKQKELLDGQTLALQGLDFLTQFQSQALAEGRENLQKLAEFGHRQQVELLQRQEQLHEAHDHLIRNSQSILAAQEAFESKQATIFAALDKLFALHNAILMESRAIKAFFFYSIIVFVLYMITSAKQTCGVRARLYLGLCTVFAIEFSIVRLGANDLDQQAWVASKVFLVRSIFMLAASAQVIHSIVTFRDYEVLNHKMLLTLVEKLNAIEENTGKNLLSMRAQSDIRLFSWIDAELPEDESYCGDPDYNLQEEVAENSVTTTSTSITRKYNLRPRR